MADREVLFRFKGDTSDLDRAVAQATAGLEEFTAEELAVAKAVKGANRALDDQSKALGVTTGDLKSARAALKAQASAQAAAGKAAADADREARDARVELVELLGGPSKDVVDKLTKAQALLGSGTLAAASAFAGAAVGVAVFSAAAFGSVLAADDLARSLAEIKGLGAIDGFAVSPETLDSLDTANAAVAALGAVAQRAVVTLGESFAPAVTGLSKGATFLSLAFGEAWATLSSGEYVFQGIATVIKTVLLEALLAPLSSLELLTLGIAKLADLAGLDTVSAKAKQAAADLGGLKESLGGTSVSNALDSAGASVVRLAVKTNALTAVMKDKAAADRGAGKASDAAKAAEEERRATVAALEADLKGLGDAQRAANKATDDAAKASAALVKQAAGLAAGPVDAVEALRASYRDLDAQILAQIEANAAAGISTEALEQSRVDLARRVNREIQAIEQERRDDAAEADKAAAAAARAYYAELGAAAADAAQSIAGALGDVAGLFLDKWTSALDATQEKLAAVSAGLEELGAAGVNAGALTGDALTQAYLSGKVSLEDLSAAQQAQLETRLKAEETYLAGVEAAQRDAAMKAFNLSKAASVSAAIVAGALAVVQTLATPLVGPIAKAALVAGVVATTGAQIATIAAEQPTFHSGGFVDAVSAGAAPGRSYAPDEVGAKLQTGEAVLSRVARSTLGDDTIRRLNRGEGAAPVVNVTQTYEGRIIGTVVQDQIKTSSALRRSLATTRPGHRVR